MSLQANKSDIKSYHSCKNFTQFQTGWVYFQICVVNFGYYCDLLSGFLSSLLIETFLLHLHENLWYCAMSGKSPSMLYYFWIFPIALPHLNVSWCYKMVPNFFFLGGGGRGRWDLQVSYNRWITIFLFIMLIRKLSSTYFWPFASKFCTDTILLFWVTICQGIIHCANRYTKVSKGVPGDSTR